MLFVGPEAEKRYGHRHFLEVLSVFTSDPEFRVLHGKTEIGAVDPIVITRKVDGPRVLVLGGRAWTVTYIDWKRRRAFVEPSDLSGSSRWSGSPQPLSYSVTDATRRVLIGADPPNVALTKRAQERLAGLRAELSTFVAVNASVVLPHGSGQARWWTWAGGRANAVVAAAVAKVEPTLLDQADRYDNRYVKLRGDATAPSIRRAINECRVRFGSQLSGVDPEVSGEAVKQLKFAELLPPALAIATLAERSQDLLGVGALLERGIR